MNADERLAAVKRQIADAEASVLQALASARAGLTAVEEENYELRRESLERQTEALWTESEFARLFKVSESTMARTRRAGKLRYRMVGQQVRYSVADYEYALEVFARSERVKQFKSRATEARRHQA